MNFTWISYIHNHYNLHPLPDPHAKGFNVLWPTPIVRSPYPRIQCTTPYPHYQIPIPKDSIDLEMSRWFQSVASVLQIEMKYEQRLNKRLYIGDVYTRAHAYTYSCGRLHIIICTRACAYSHGRLHIIICTRAYTYSCGRLHLLISARAYTYSCGRLYLLISAPTPTHKYTYIYIYMRLHLLISATTPTNKYTYT